MMECANCGRHNQPTTRFCAECGDVLRTDPPREPRSRSKKRARRLRARTRWIRVAPVGAPSILAAKRRPASAAIVAEQESHDGMIRRIDLLFALLVCIAGFGAYLGFPHLQALRTQSAQAMPEARRAPPPVAQVPLAPLELPPPRTSDVAAATPVAASLAPLPASPRLDVVPPRTPAPPPAKPDTTARRSPESVLPPPPRKSYAVTTAYGIDSFGPPPAPAPVRSVAPPPRAPARVDPLQQMNDALAACAGDGLFGRIACEQRALLAYCDGRWGQTERCPSGRRTDYGN